MPGGRTMLLAARTIRRSPAAAVSFPRARGLATVAPVIPAGRSHKVVVIGGGSAGLSISCQLLRTGKFSQDDIAVVDPAAWHHYQPGWTLVGGGIKTQEELRRPLKDLINPRLKFYNERVSAMLPAENTVWLDNGERISYEQLVVVPGIKINYDSIKGLPEALADPDSLVSSTYGEQTCKKVFPSIQKLQRGTAIFTQPAGTIKCGGGPQKIMWLALDYWKRRGLYDTTNPSGTDIRITFATATPTMFGVPKYSAALEAMRQERQVEGLFQHDLVSIDGDKATFARGGGSAGSPSSLVTRRFDFLHVVPKMGPHAFVRDSELADAAGFVDVDAGTTRSARYANVWSVGDASSLPTSKTTAAITAQVPILVRNLVSAMEGSKTERLYEGYTSCPIVTDYNSVLLAEFKYNGEPTETFGMLGIDQSVPRRAFYHLKRDFFPWVYYKFMVKGLWPGPRGWVR